MKIPSIKLLPLMYLNKPDLPEQSYVESAPCVTWRQLFVDPL